MPDFGAMLQSINWNNPSWDLFLILFFVIGALFYGISLGRDRITVIMVSIYMALAVVNYAPFLTTFNADVQINNAFSFRIVAFLGLFVLLFFFLSQSALLKSFGSESYGKLWQVVIFSVIHVGLLLSVTLSFMPESMLASLSPVSHQLFIADAAKAVWITLPIVAMALLKNRE